MSCSSFLPARWFSSVNAWWVGSTISRPKEHSGPDLHAIRPFAVVKALMKGKQAPQMVREVTGNRREST